MKEITLPKMIDISSILKELEIDTRLNIIKDNFSQSTKFQNYLLDEKGVLHWSHDARTRNMKLSLSKTMLKTMQEKIIFYINNSIIELDDMLEIIFLETKEGKCFTQDVWGLL